MKGIFEIADYDKALCGNGHKLQPTGMFHLSTPGASCDCGFTTVTKGEFRRLFKRSWASVRTILRRQHEEDPQYIALTGYRDKKGKQHIKNIVTGKSVTISTTSES